jgi:ketosteroid isomerase-like protein
MPQDNTEIVRRGFDAWNRRDDEAVLNYFTEAIEIEEVLPAGDRVVVLVRVSGQGRASGAAVDSRSAWVARVDAGKVTNLRLYRDRAEALAAVSE